MKSATGTVFQRIYSHFSFFSNVTTKSVHTSFPHHRHHVCIIGSGPAGFYAAQQIAKSLENSHVDIYEKLPVPFGLVRYGVAPDHPEVKNVINTFTNVLRNPRVSFIGNIEVGKDIAFSQLSELYDAILLCYGASEDRKLGITGESDYVIPGREFVGWYNGLPENRGLQIDLESSERAFIIGQGNVALDIARILLSPIDILRKTDISTYALDALSKSRVKEVIIYGRRGPLQVAFTIKELRELTKLDDVRVILNPSDFYGVNDELIANLPRPKRRLTELLYRTCQNQSQFSATGTHRKLSLTFLRSPLEISQDIGSKRLKVTFGVNKLDSNTEQVSDTGNREYEFCDLVFRSVGYKGRKLFHELPFDDVRGIIPNENGKVQPGVYCCGWVGQGPRGVILSTMQNSFEVGKLVAKDLASSKDSQERGGLGAIRSLLPPKKRFTSFEDYKKIAEYEHLTGTKVTTIEEMLRIANQATR